MSGVSGVAFKEFANNLSKYTNFWGEIPEHLENTYQAFVKELNFTRRIELKFAELYQVNLTGIFQGERGIITCTKIFRNLFPDVKLEKQEAKFLSEHKSRNPFAIQWDLISKFITEHPEALEKALIDVFDLDLEDKVKERRIYALLGAGAPLSPAVVAKALINDNFEFFHLFRCYGYKPNTQDFKTLFSMEDDEKKKWRLMYLIERCGHDKSFSKVIDDLVEEKNYALIKLLLLMW